MQNGTLVAMIDVCLERLQAVRRLLTIPGDKAAAKEILKVSDPRIAKAKKKARLQIKNKKTKDELTPSLFDQVREFKVLAPEPTAAKPLLKPHVQPDYVAPRLESPGSQSVVKPRRVTTAPRKKAAAPAGALSGQVPAGPVFIPAAQVRSEHERKQAEAQAERNAFGSDSIPLTAESLARRWLQSANQ